MNKTCKIIALIHVIVSIGIIIWLVTSRERPTYQNQNQMGLWITDVTIFLGPISVHWLIHSIFCSYNLWFVNIILLMILVIFGGGYFLREERRRSGYALERRFREERPTNDDTQDNTK